MNKYGPNFTTNGCVEVIVTQTEMQNEFYESVFRKILCWRNLLETLSV